jgi:DNA repair protein NreA
MVSTARLCVTCKGGRNLCGLGSCPLLGRFRVRPRIEHALKEDFFGPATSVFIGRYGYPNVASGPLSPMVADAQGAGGVGVIDDPGKWFGMPYQDIVEMRSMLLRTKETGSVFSKGRMASDLQEIALSSRAPDVEMLLKGKPVYRVSFSDVSQPMGPTARLKRLSLTENVKIRGSIERVVSDDLTAAESATRIYALGEDVYKISTILSSGALGLGDRRKLVPTRWSITGTDDIIARELLKSVKGYPSINEYLVFESQYLDNHFIILMMPGGWEFENFEAWAPGTPWSMGAKRTEIIEEYEPFNGRTSYAENQGGGYYATRIAVVEKLHELRRQAQVIVFREVHEGYVIPLGVFVVRETARDACKKAPRKFQDKEAAISYIGTKLRLPISEYAGLSKTLRRKKLLDFF